MRSIYSASPTVNLTVASLSVLGVGESDYSLWMERGLVLVLMLLAAVVLRLAMQLQVLVVLVVLVVFPLFGVLVLV
ncbi:MAG: hypothetical protein ICV61_18315, partial [Microcoleus sp. Co-bin12]|nr:hypothetical protein [Microcoleus sp. Co-bin12]